MNGFFSYARWVLFIFCLLLQFSSFCLWACLEITHNAQPHKLTDSCMGHGVIRWRQYHSVSRSAITAPLISCFCLPSRVLSTHWWKNACERAGSWLLLPPPPRPSVSACHICFCSSTHIANAFRCYKGIYTALQHILKCQMLPYFCFVWMSRIWNSDTQRTALGQIWPLIRCQEASLKCSLIHRVRCLTLGFFLYF